MIKKTVNTCVSGSAADQAAPAEWLLRLACRNEPGVSQTETV